MSLVQEREIGVSHFFHTSANVSLLYSTPPLFPPLSLHCSETTTDKPVRPSKEERERRAAEKKAYIAMRANHAQSNGHLLVNGTSDTNGSIGGTVGGSEEDADGEEE